MEDSPEVQQQHQQLEEDRLDDETQDADDQAAYNESSEDEEFNQKNFGIYQALPVEGEPDWSLEEPDSAEEYLRRVRYEAARCPKVVRVEPTISDTDANNSKELRPLPAPEAIPDAPDWAKPNRSWVQRFVADFQQLRLQVHEAYEQGAYPTVQVPHMNDGEAWDRTCFGHTAQAEVLHMQAAAGAEMTQLTPGICSKILALEQPEVASLFLRHCQQLHEQCPDSLPLLRAQWLFALASRLEKPCHAEVAAGFRSLLRHCCKLRAGVTHDADPLLPKLNVLIVMAGAYFAQDEHWCSVVDSSELL
eukprot:GHUV01004258.1.p1 GENE.GHUV01004258.1~~GHUV01004258.1.p1  ORF type:complete len:305 (+),score=93.79 GHUV01004258.1:284-1198(+)